MNKFWENLKLKNNIRPLDNEVYLSIAAIMKNEGSYLKEWIEYHKLVGVERFYLYDNESTDNTYEILKPYIQDGTVVYKYVKGRSKQNFAYQDAVYHYKNETKWLAIIDLDEYIVPVEKNTVPEFLREFEKYPAIAVNWVMFDCNGHDEKPEGLIIGNYTRIQKDYNLGDCHVKSIVNPQKVIDIINPHFCYYKGGECAVVETGKKMCGIFSKFIRRCLTKQHSSNKIHINHYHCKSKSEYKQKILTLCADSGSCRTYQKEAVEFTNYTYNTLIVDKYLEPLKKAMEEK